VTALVAVPFLRQWAGGRVRTYVAVAGGLLGLLAAESLTLFRSTPAPGGLDMIAWDSVYIHAAGYLAIGLGLLVWVRDLRRCRDELQRDNINLKQMAATDFLTELFTRRQALLHVEHEMARAKRTGKPMAFIMVDLDRFKLVNDTYGHQAGDAVLVHVAKLLKGRMRASDIVARYGGEEFLLVLPETDLASAVQLANGLHQLLHLHPAKYDALEISVLASFGIAMHSAGQNSTIKEIVGRADASLYTAKGLGGDRVITWQDVSGPRASPDPVVAITGT
jgi:diguanylate cyclase (GGDEF)-like protein